MKRLLISLACVVGIAILFACGGGSGGNDTPAVSPPQHPRVNLAYGYFGIDGDQIAETADHVTFVLAMDWGDWNLAGYDAFRTSQTITQLEEAKARGIKDAWVAVGYLVFTQSPGCISVCYHTRPDAIPRLLAYKQQLDAAGVLDMVKALYPVDEPELYGLSDAQLSPVLAQIKQAWPGPKLAVIYGSGAQPGKAQYDWIGMDDYGKGAGVLNELPQIAGAQEHIIVPGGASPWKQDPQPFYDYAQAHTDVAAIVPFVWFDRPAGQDSGPGIRSNGMAPAYRAIGASIKASGPAA